MVNRRVLVVEQDVHLRSALRDMLEAEGCAVAETPSYEGALDLLGHDDRVQLLLVGLGLRPRDSGPALSAMRAAAGAQVVAFTALPRSAVPHDLPVEAVLDLPFTVGELRGAIGCR
jgi:DNA-binding response OmpR family regulator